MALNQVMEQLLTNTSLWIWTSESSSLYQSPMTRKHMQESDKVALTNTVTKKTSWNIEYRIIDKSLKQPKCVEQNNDLPICTLIWKLNTSLLMTLIFYVHIYVPKINLNLVALSSMDGLKIKSNRRNFRCLPHPTLQGVSSITV